MEGVSYEQGWSARLLVKVVLTVAPIYHLIALDLPKWFFKAIDKKRRGFLWKGHDRAMGQWWQLPGGLGESSKTT
jgi:hypothetical protein